MHLHKVHYRHAVTTRVVEDSEFLLIEVLTSSGNA